MPDAFGRPTQVAPYVTAVSHYRTGEPASITYANGMLATGTSTAGSFRAAWPSHLGSPHVNFVYSYL